MLAARSQTNIDNVARSLGAATQTLAIATDVSSEAQVNKLFEEANTKFGRVDVVIHAAGVLGPIAKIGDASTDEWWRAFVSTCAYTLVIGRHSTDYFTRKSMSRGRSSSPKNWLAFQRVVRLHLSTPAPLHPTSRVQDNRLTLPPKPQAT